MGRRKGLRKIRAAEGEMDLVLGWYSVACALESFLSDLLERWLDLDYQHTEERRGQLHRTECLGKPLLLGR